MYQACIDYYQLPIHLYSCKELKSLQNTILNSWLRYYQLIKFLLFMHLRVRIVSRRIKKFCYIAFMQFSPPTRCNSKATKLGKFAHAPVSDFPQNPTWDNVVALKTHMARDIIIALWRLWNTAAGLLIPNCACVCCFTVCFFVLRQRFACRKIPVDKSILVGLFGTTVSFVYTFCLGQPLWYFQKECLNGAYEF